ncbi:MAG: hypothetical protein AAGF55_17735 [Pseudomonadota bacterium]
MNTNALVVKQRKFRPMDLLGALRSRRKDLFWAWIAYQTIKGTATTALISVPALAYLVNT